MDSGGSVADRSLLYGQLDGNLNLTINGVCRNFGDFSACLDASVPLFLRGDCNDDGIADISWSWLFRSGRSWPCWQPLGR